MSYKPVHVTEKIGRTQRELLGNLFAGIRCGELAGTVSVLDCCVRITSYL